METRQKVFNAVRTYEEDMNAGIRKVGVRSARKFSALSAGTADEEPGLKQKSFCEPYDSTASYVIHKGFWWFCTV